MQEKESQNRDQVYSFCVVFWLFVNVFSFLKTKKYNKIATTKPNACSARVTGNIIKIPFDEKSANTPSRSIPVMYPKVP
ncbi:MAG: hypothetical protein ACTSUW_02220, partial [Candidatus Heimdallarchaeota archaeon]